jgi:hypothetical protein
MTPGVDFYESVKAEKTVESNRGLMKIFKDYRIAY